MASITMSAPRAGQTYYIGRRSIEFEWNVTLNSNERFSRVSMRLKGVGASGTGSTSSVTNSGTTSGSMVGNGLSGDVEAWLEFTYTRDSVTQPIISTTKVVIKAFSGAPSVPIITSPSAGYEVFVTESLRVAWQYRATNDMAQGGYEVAFLDTGTNVWSTVASGTGATNTANVPAHIISLSNAKRYARLRVRTMDTGDSWSDYSDEVTVLYKSTNPDKPVPTKPANLATSFPQSALDFAFSYTANGGYALRQIIFDWYYSGQTAWNKRLTFTTSSASFTVPANTFASIGTVYWRIQAINSNNESSTWSDTRTLYIASPVASAPLITAPTAGATVFTNANLTVSWQYRGVTGVAQGGYKIEINDTGSWRVVATGTGTGTSAIIPAGTVSLTNETRNVSIRVSTQDAVSMTWSAYSSAVTVAYRSTNPDKPVPTKPANLATSYPKMPIEIAFNYAANGGYAILRVRFEWHYAGEEAYRRFATFETSSPSITLPANFFWVGTITWRIQVTNTNGNTSPYSDGRTLYLASSAPLAPSLSAPDNGATLYNNTAVVFRWQYNTNVDVAQGTYEVQYRLRGVSTWTTAQQTSSASQHTVAASAISLGIVEWRVRTANTLGEWSAYSETRSFTFSEPLPVTPEILEPVGGYIDRAVAVLVSWTYESPISSAQAAFELQYRLAGGNWAAITGGAVKSYTLAALTLPQGSVELRVRVRDVANRWSNWSSTRTISTDEPAPLAPTPLEPVEIYLSVASAIRFRWQHNSAVGGTQAKAELRYRYEGGAFTTQTINGSAMQYLLAAFTFSPGTISWQVRTYNREGDASPWSALVSAGITGAPSTPVITEVSGNGGRLTIGWSAPGQITYELLVIDETGQVITDLRDAATGDSMRVRTPDFYAPGLYTIQVRANNQYDYWSEYGTAAKLIQYTAPQEPLIGLRPADDAVEISIYDVDFDRYTAYIYRNGVPIAVANGTMYYDRTVGAYQEYAYFVRVVDANDAYADSDVHRITIILGASWLSLRSAAGSARIHLNVSAPPVRTGDYQSTVKLLTVTGRKMPIAVYGEYARKVYTVKYAIRTVKDLDTLNNLLYSNAPLLYRDTYGRRDWCCLSDFAEEDINYESGARTVSLYLEAVDQAEEITIL